jgi:hypothetical protein
MATLAIAIFVAVFAIATFRNIHLGVLVLPAACAVGVWLAGMPLATVVAGFPVSILVLLAGSPTSSASRKATAPSIAPQTLLAAVGARRGLLPSVLPDHGGGGGDGLAAGGYVVMPLAMPAARRSGIDAMLMAVAINAGISAGGLAPPASSASSPTARPVRPASISIR